jgi:hypothetical protein
MRALRTTTVGILFAVLAWATPSAAATTTGPSTITWSGLSWDVKSGTGLGPGPNTWNPDNVFVDASGDLHLAITNVGGSWTCAEVSTTTSFPFGSFQWQVTTAVDNLDPNVVLGLFVYGPLALGPDGTHEIDIEYARFGSADADNGRWTIWPNVLVTPSLVGRSSYTLQLGSDPTTTSRFTWAPSDVAFTTLAGFQAPGSNTNLVRSWTYAPGDPTTTISQSPMPVHMNLWLNQGAPPTNGQGVEVVIHNFSFTPAAAVSVPALAGDWTFVLAAALIGTALLWARNASSLSAPRPRARRARPGRSG